MVGGGDASIRVQPHSALPTQVRIQPHSALQLLRSGYNPTQHKTYSGQDTTPLSTIATQVRIQPHSALPTQVRIQPHSALYLLRSGNLLRLQSPQKNRAFHGQSSCNGICLVFETFAKVRHLPLRLPHPFHISQQFTHSYFPTFSPFSHSCLQLFLHS